MAFSIWRGCTVVWFLALASGALAQQAQSSIEQARLYQQTPNTTATRVNADGMALVDADDTSGDDSFGSQLILKNQERVRPFLVSADVSGFFTSNVALTRRDAQSDSLLVANVGGSWTFPLASHLEAQFAARGSLFRYDENPELDFQSVGAGFGLAYSPPNLAGVSVFARYDFTDLINRHSREILNDHEFSIGAQKVIAFGRAHALSFGALASAGIADPFSSQRDQVAAFVAYRLQLTRKLETDFAFRAAGYFYNAGGRNDANQLLSWHLLYRITDWADVNAFASFADNRSTRSVFDYDAFTTGGGLSLTVRF